MKRKKNKNIQPAGNTEEVTEKMIDRFLDELGREDGTIEEIEEKVRQHKTRFRRRVAVVAALVIFAAVGIYLLIHLQTYTGVRIVASYTSEGAGNNNYEQFAGGVLKYSRDGIALLNKKGEEQWNQPYQIKTPVIEVCRKTAAVGDKGGNNIAVFNEKGLKGEIHTTLPIEKISVSAQGIVCAVLKNDSSPNIVTYDAMGNILAEVKTSFASTGYPLDVSISEDGQMLLVSCMKVENGQTVTNVFYYYFDEARKEGGDYQVVADVYEDAIAPETFFMDKSVSAVVGDGQVLIYSGVEKPELKQTIKLEKRIKSVFHNQRYIGLILKNEGEAGFELCLYNTGGKKVMSENFTGDYTNVKIDDNQVIMYDGKKCSVFTKTGIHKFEGEMGNDILEMFPVFGVNKYVVINANGLEIVRFVK